MRDLFDLLALVAEGYVLRKFRAPQEFECWLEGPNLEAIPFDPEHYDQIRAACVAYADADRIPQERMTGSDAIESWGFRPDIPSESKPDDPGFLSETGTLEVHFIGRGDRIGERYRYFGVPRLHQIKFLKAQYPLVYLNGFIAKNYAYQRMAERPPVSTCIVRLQLRDSIDALLKSQRTTSLQALYDSAGIGGDEPVREAS